MKIPYTYKYFFKAMPCLSKDLMLSVLRELKIETLQTEYEADQVSKENQIALVANDE